MKTRIATLMMVLGIFIATTAFASEPVPASKAVSKSVSEYIEKNLDYPEFAIKEKFECCVMAEVTIQKDGTFLVTGCNCMDKRMKKYVAKAIYEMDEKADYYAQFAGQQIYMKIIFDLKLI